MGRLTTCYDPLVLKLLTAPVTNDRSPRYAERAFAAIHQAGLRRGSITLLYAASDGRVGLFLKCSEAVEGLVTGPIAANYPNCTVAAVESIDAPPADWQTWSAELELRPELFPLLRHAQFEDMLNGNYADPVSGILRAVTPAEDVHCRIEIEIAPAPRKRRKAARQALRLLDRDFFRRHHKLAEFYAEHATRGRVRALAWTLGLLARQSPHPVRTSLDTSGSRIHDREEKLQAAGEKIGGHLFETHIRLVAEARPEHEDIALDRIRQMAGALGAFTQSRLATFHVGHVRRGEPGRSREGSLLSHEEIATLFHPPCATVAAERMQTMDFRELEPPPIFHAGEEEGSVTLGRVLFRDDERPIGIDQEARRRHVYIVGATGAGKSTLLLNLIRQEMLAGRGLTVLDVHGDLAAAALSFVPKRRTNDVIVFDPATENVIPFNPLACRDPARIDQVTSGVVSAFRKLYDSYNSWGPRLENLLRYSVYVTVEQGGTLLDLLMLLTDKGYRESAILRVRDDVVRSFWLNEFASWAAPYRTEAVSSVTNKLMPFLTSSRMRAITAAACPYSLDLRRVMDEEKILIASISRGRLGQDNATLLGSLLLTAIEQAALTRADLPEEERKDHALFLDEFQSLVTPSTAIMLSESRKYRLGLTLSHQLTKQLDPATYHAVIGNCGTLISFRVGLEDAELLAPAMSKHAGQLAPADLTNLPNYTAYVRLLLPDGHPSRPFSMRTLPPMSSVDDPDRSLLVRRASDRQYGRPADTVVTKEEATPLTQPLVLHS